MQCRNILDWMMIFKTNFRWGSKVRAMQELAWVPKLLLGDESFWPFSYLYLDRVAIQADVPMFWWSGPFFANLAVWSMLQFCGWFLVAIFITGQFCATTLPLQSLNSHSMTSNPWEVIQDKSSRASNPWEANQDKSSRTRIQNKRKRSSPSPPHTIPYPGLPEPVSNQLEIHVCETKFHTTTWYFLSFLSSI